MARRRRYLITGAAGAAAAGIRPILRDRGADLVLLDVAPVRAGTGEVAIRADLTDAAAVQDALRGVDMVIHLGGFSRERPWSDIAHANIDGTRTLLEAMVRADVRHALIASSTHVVGFWPIPSRRVESLPSRPDSYYGVSKVAIEGLASAFADRHDLVLTLARIGTVEPAPSSPRSLATWLSFPDLVRLVEATAGHTVPGAHPVWAVSRNTRRWFSLEPGRAIGYEPEDDAEEYAARFAMPDDAGNGLIGGAFADASHPLGVAW
ncbi:NAD-dependent epimerase/dehydratase family protein [Myceligenerans pegani]|uniref:NAD(P)-dependent oxidoreductase n=1 Tax=Myceligenerans pegani TaxID=2776917 RepID=A0ABR9N2N9_9MICO|nr:NAD(P)-dependent oxidoreductase [Myceligenerans sp. TRM 65318]MBE1877630.1 NAD(P)-dependent oxidoreductase [Myceligenerans sp. TRM 65318]MBE3019901.1 NAD(P)-dependent oxidoreductase [Myceligenerans sp. TRM 65318]